MNPSDTVVAISSAAGPAARMIVRASGPEAHRLARELCSDCEPSPGSAQRVELSLESLCFNAHLYCFGRPRSYTGEDLAEFHIPGSPVLGRILLERLMSLGARLAEPGEFTARAFFNGRIDLTQAEGVAATIAAHSEGELLAARQLMAGELARRLAPITEQIAQAIAMVEAGIDFSDEGIEFLPRAQLLSRCRSARDGLNQLLRDSSRFERLAHEPRIVLFGPPNAGKSTLLNALAGAQRAVVSEIAGTTRDAIWSPVRLARGIVRVFDVAGIDALVPPDDTPGFSALGTAQGDLETQMRSHALRAAEDADVLVLVQAVDQESAPPMMARAPDLVVRTKADLRPDDDSTSIPNEVAVSAHDGYGLDRLHARLDELAFGKFGASGSLALNARHVQAIERAGEALERVEAENCCAEVVALELREALDALGEISGRISPDELLGRIFAQFCIGK